MTTISERQLARIYIYKTKKIRNISIYKMLDALQKSRQFALRFFSKIQTLYITLFFMKILKLAFVYKKHNTCVT